MKNDLITFRNPEAPISESFRNLKTNLQFMNVSKQLNTLLVTSVFPEEGKSFIASNLAVTFSKEGNKVLIIDADMRKPNLNSIFGIASKGGFSNYLAGIKKKTNRRGLSKDIIDTATIYIETTKITNLDYMSAGDIPPNPSELLLSNRLEKLLKEVSSIYDIVIIDAPSCCLTTDSIIISSLVDAAVIVVEYGKTGKRALKQVVKNFNEVEANVIGAILNRVAKNIKIEQKYSSISIEELKQLKMKKQELVNTEEQEKTKTTKKTKTVSRKKIEIQKDEKLEENPEENKKQTETKPKQTPRKTQTRKKTTTKKQTTNKISKSQQIKEAKERTNDLLESITKYAGNDEKE